MTHRPHPVRRATARLAAILAALTLAAAAVVGGCGLGDDDTDVLYAPAAFGEYGQCYYVFDDDEVEALQADGLCPAGWVPVQAPPAWHLAYWPYLSSSVYVDHYVPRHHRDTFWQREAAYGAKYAKDIQAAASKPTTRYKGSNGKMVTADKLGVTKYGGGNRAGFGGGNRTNDQIKAKQSRGGGSSQTGSGGGGSGATAKSDRSLSKSFGSGSRSGFGSAGRK